MSRTLSLAAAALLTLAIAGCGDDTATMPATEPSDVPSASAGVQPPAGFQFVGVGHAAIAVPAAWGRNKIHCGYTPEEDTYIVDISGVAACGSQRGKNLETLAGTADGSALTRSTWDKDPNKGRSWVAAKPGTSKVTLFITVDGEKVELGTFTVVVKPAR